MDIPVVVPQLGNEITEAEVTEWLKAAGDRVEAGELIVVITTPKVSLEIEAPAGGILKEIALAEGDLAEVGATLAVITEG